MTLSILIWLPLAIALLSALAPRALIGRAAVPGRAIQIR